MMTATKRMSGNMMVDFRVTIPIDEAVIVRLMSETGKSRTAVERMMSEEIGFRVRQLVSRRCWEVTDGKLELVHVDDARQ